MVCQNERHAELRPEAIIEETNPGGGNQEQIHDQFSASKRRTKCLLSPSVLLLPLCVKPDAFSLLLDSVEGIEREGMSDWWMVNS